MKKGFTLMELIIVITIIGIMVSLALPRFAKIVIKAKATEALFNMGAMRSALIRYYSLNGRYTTLKSDLDILDPDTTPGAHFTYGIWVDEDGNGFGITATCQRGCFGMLDMNHDGVVWPDTTSNEQGSDFAGLTFP